MRRVRLVAGGEKAGYVSLSNNLTRKGIGLVASIAETLTLISLLLDFNCLGEILLFFPLDRHPNCTVVDVVTSVAELILRGAQSAIIPYLIRRTYLVMISLLKDGVLKEWVRCEVEQQFEPGCVIGKILQADIDQKGKSGFIFLSDS